MFWIFNVIVVMIVMLLVVVVAAVFENELNLFSQITDY